MRYTGHIIIAIAFLLGVWLLSSTLRYKFQSEETVTVTGLAEKDFTADQIVWQGSFIRTGFDLKAAYASLKLDEAEIRRYLNAAGIPDTSILFGSVDMQRIYDSQFDMNGRSTGNTFKGFSLTGRVTVDSKNIAAVEKLSREITGLLEKGIELNSTPPSYFYSGLNALKIDLLAKAAADARQRAESMAENAGGKLSSLKKANMGVFQIRGKNANEDFSYGGVYNTSSKEKTASITLKVNFGIR